MTGAANPTAAESQAEFQHYHAPREHCDHLIQPALGEAADLIGDNLARSQSLPDPIGDLRQPARKQMLRDARRYTSAYRDVDFSEQTDQSIVMAGHQPTLFHPGVWFKNFALAQIGSATRSTAVNLVVDVDVTGPSSVRVPRRNPSTGAIGTATVPYDRRGGGVPYEQALIEDREMFDGFDHSVMQTVAGVVENPLIESLWQYAREAINRCGYAGCALAQARHRLEADLGLQTLEIPQSVICRSESFASFVMQILRDLPRFQSCYNESAELYRKAHGIRSSAHPVPNLGRDGDWYEAPLWVYGNQTPKRRGVWVRSSAAGKVLEISDRGNLVRRIDAADLPAADEAFLALGSPEFKIRSRALLTTMYARTVLSDLFLHGIGGGKYDQLGDLISHAFWGTEPPNLMVLSATVLLPGHEHHPLTEIDAAIAGMQRRRRDLQYQGERFTDGASIDPEWVKAKQALISNIPPKGQRSEWHQEITKLNQKIAAALQDEMDQVDAALTELSRRRRAAAIWNSREHSFCVYPLQYLTSAYQQMLPAIPARRASE